MSNKLFSLLLVGFTLLSVITSLLGCTGPLGPGPQRSVPTKGPSVVVDGTEGSHYDSVWGLIFSPDGKRVAYLASLNKKYFVVVDGTK